MFNKNMGPIDRAIRMIVGIVSLTLAVFLFEGAAQVVAFVITGLALFTSLTGFCLIYKILGINTLPKNIEPAVQK